MVKLKTGKTVRLSVILLITSSWLSSLASTATTIRNLQSNNDPAFSEKANRLLGTYEAVPLTESIPEAHGMIPATLDVLPLTPSAAALQIVEKSRPDPKDLCQVLGPFRLMARPDLRFEILHDAPDKLVLLFENIAWGHVRTISIDADHIRNFEKIRPMWSGDSVAKWEDDTLVVDTIHFTNKTWLNEQGVTNSKQLHLTERFHMMNDGKFLEYIATAVDPDVLVRPVTYTRYFKRTAREIAEYDCFVHKADRKKQ